MADIWPDLGDTLAGINRGVIGLYPNEYVPEGEVRLLPMKNIPDWHGAPYALIGRAETLDRFVKQLTEGSDPTCAKHS